MMGWSNGYGMMGGGWFGYMLIPLIIIGVIIYAVFKLSNNNKNGRYASQQHDSSLDILNERFAKGDITEEEYNRKKDMLMKR